ncbi:MULTISPECIES: MFS transporter [Actinoalloteichus]|uniref:Arabinose efflux permease family protein n=1 Tax=Actinoalloteichus fjordicus TaxID=1612552 RepID=A0AAC9L9S2_9PSEU|nr:MULTISPECIES: MFS transporter [Actinoalloteichus]APU13576.1 arabinose efflux permease family protein [Actinoalloteichus fjordicus]APU19523.1 arabinose efflux permease family protein [Actinoalloteichus sp. GBA129-24]
MTVSIDPDRRAGPEPEPGADATPISDRRRWLAVVVLAAALALDSGGVAVVNAALPAIGADLSITDTTLQWMMTSYALTFAGFLLFGGRAADVLGRRYVFALGVAIFCIAAVGAALAPNAELLMVARGLQGIGAALSGPASLALVTQLFPAGPERYKALAVYTSVGASSFSAGVVIGGVLTDVFNWRSVFVFNLLIGVAVLAAVRSVLPKGTRRRLSLDVPGAAAVTLGLLFAVFGLTRASEEGWDGLTLGALAAAAVMLVGFVIWERRIAQPLLPMDLLRVPAVRAATVTAVVFFTAVLGVLFFAPLYLQGLLGYTPMQSGLAILPMGILVIISTNISGRLMVRVGQRNLMITGLLLLAVGMVLWARTPLDGGYWLDVFPAVAVMSIGQGTAFAALTAGSLTGVPQHQHGVAGGFNVTAQQLGGSIGVALLVTAASVLSPGTDPESVLGGYHVGYLVAMGLLVFGAVLVAVLLRGERSGSRATRSGEETTTN